MYKKIFIAFEGIDGSGKTMHSLAMAKKIKSLKIPCVYIREPGGSKEAESIRKFLLSKTSRNFDSLTDTLLYLAARNENFFKVLFISILIGFLIFLLKEVVTTLTTNMDI